jgi:hypothetical protein
MHDAISQQYLQVLNPNQSSPKTIDDEEFKSEDSVSQLKKVKPFTMASDMVTSIEISSHDKMKQISRSRSSTALKPKKGKKSLSKVKSNEAMLALIKRNGL